MSSVSSLRESDYDISPAPKSIDWVCPIDVPKTRNEVHALFGNPGIGKVDAKWEKANMTVAKNLRGSWGKGKLYCHKLAEECIRHALDLSYFRGCIDEIEQIGCFSFRHQRHDQSRPLSYHSWGIAVDINPKKNKGIYRSDARIDPPFVGNWSDIYPDGVSEKLVEAFKESGFNWGGDWHDFCDPMHFSLAPG